MRSIKQTLYSSGWEGGPEFGVSGAFRCMEWEEGRPGGN